MTDFIEIKRAIHTLTKIGCTSITIDRLKFRKVLCEHEWPDQAGEVKNDWWIYNGTDIVRIFGVEIIERVDK